MCYDFWAVAAERSPRWGATTKLVVALVFIALFAVIVRRFADLLAPVVVAVMVAYVLNPPVTYLADQLKVSRGLAVALIYVALILLLVGGSTALGIAIQRQIVAIDDSLDLQQILADLPEQLDRVLHGRIIAGPFTVILDDTTQPATTPIVIDLSAYDLEPLYQQAVAAIQPLLSQGGRIVGDFASAAASTLGWALFILVITFYMLVDAPRIAQSIQAAAFPGYEHDLRRILEELGHIWNAFLRGQLLLALVIFAITTLAMVVLGLRNALVVGLIAGLLEFVPIIGPFIAGAIGVAIALFQPENPLGMSTLGYATVILIVFLVIQQVENNVLVPRILGDSLNLHPLAILLAAVMGASLAGVLGLLLAAPVLATIRLLGNYAYRKFFDLDPWPERAPPKPRQGFRLRLPRLPRRRSAPAAPDLPRAEYSYRVYWTKTARAWDEDRRRRVAEAAAVTIARADFEPTAYERRYVLAELDGQAHSGQSLLALHRVLAALAETPVAVERTHDG
jgi:predicted PurR-regulated permease PerM